MRPSGSSRARSGLAILALAVGVLVPAPVAARAPIADDAAPPLVPPGSDLLARDSWIVTLRDGIGADAAPALARAAGGAAGLRYKHGFSGFQFKGSARAAEALRRNPHVASVEPDRPVFLTEVLPFGVRRTDAFVLGGDSAYEAGYRGNGARIAILDTGIDLDHPDLAESIDRTTERNCVTDGAPANDGYGHGTHVAGTAAAPLNGVGVVGVAPEAELVPVKVFDDAGNSSEAYVLCGLDHIVALNTDGDPANDIDVANMSWGEQRAWGDCASDALHRVICAAHAANIKLVGGAGNSATTGATFVPAAYPEVFSTSALADFDGEPGGAAGCGWVPSLGWFECDDTLAFFSNTVGTQDFIAPGVNVHSTWAGGGYATQQGTSMATPHVTGIVALLAALDPTLTPAAVRDVLLTSGECPNGQWADADATPGCAGQGNWPDDVDGAPETLPNALRAAEAVAGGPPPPPPPPPEPEAPGAPVLTNATGGLDSIDLAWSAPASDGGSPITGYEIWRGASAGGETLVDSVGVQATYTDTAVDPGTTYWYQVAAINDVGSGPRSNELSATLVLPPSAPTLLGAPADQAVALSWTPPADDGGGQLTGYSVYRRVGSDPETSLATIPPDTTVYVDLAVTNGTSYTYRVTATNPAGEGAFSNAVTVVPTGAATAPGAPQNLTAAKAKGNVVAIELVWDAPSSDGGSPVSTYFVYRRGPGQTAFTFLANTANGDITTFTDASVERRTTYTYHVTAWNAYGPSPPSNEATVRSK